MSTALRVQWEAKETFVIRNDVEQTYRAMMSVGLNHGYEYPMVRNLCQNCLLLTPAFAWCVIWGETRRTPKRDWKCSDCKACLVPETLTDNRYGGAGNVVVRVSEYILVLWGKLTFVVWTVHL